MTDTVTIAVLPFDGDVGEWHMRRSEDDQEIKISVVGPFRVESADGEDLTPRGRKACCLLALLALSPNLRRSRAALQDKLWSDRAPEQGSASLRQSLSEIRKSFGVYRDCLKADLRIVALDTSGVSIDLHEMDLSELAQVRHQDPPILMEGLDLRDPEFEHWVAAQRRDFQRDLDEKGHNNLVVYGDAACSAPTVVKSMHTIRPWVRILPQQFPSGDSGAFIAQLVGETIVYGIAENGAVDICEFPRDTPGIDIRVEVLPTPQSTCVHVTLLATHTNTQLWSGTQSISNGAAFIADSPKLHALINQAIDIACLQLGNLFSDQTEKVASASALQAVQKMYRLDRDELSQANALLKEAYETDPRGIFLAWRAYAQTFNVGDHGVSNVLAQKDRTEALVRKAIEKEPQNSTVLALASYVYSFMMHDFEVGHELAERSLKYNPTNVLGLAFLGRAKSYLGKFEEGYRLAARARETCGPGPHQFTLDFLCGITAVMSARFDEAVRLGEIARTLVPAYRPPQRYLVPLYLKMGETEKARQVYEDLRKIEPEFSLDAMRNASYPSAGLREAGLLEFSDKDL